MVTKRQAMQIITGDMSPADRAVYAAARVDQRPLYTIQSGPASAATGQSLSLDDLVATIARAVSQYGPVTTVQANPRRIDVLPDGWVYPYPGWHASDAIGSIAIGTVAAEQRVRDEIAASAFEDGLVIWPDRNGGCDE